MKEKIALQELGVVKEQYQKRIQRVSEEYVKHIEAIDTEHKKYHTFVQYELEASEAVIDGLQDEIKKRDNQIAALKETLSIPRQHFKHIEQLTADEIVKQREIVIKEKADEMGIPQDELLQRIYAKTARKKAKL